MTHPFVLLIQNLCPACEHLKRMLAGPLGGKFDTLIQTVHRNDDPEYFAALTQQYDLRHTPALIHIPSGQVLKSSSLGEVQAFLRQSTNLATF